MASPDADDFTDTPLAAPGRAVAALIIGMAGSGKSTLVQQLSAHLSAQSRQSYIVNLDPAVKTVPYEPNVDIRDTVRFSGQVNYKSVMSEYKLGPNGGILTACNLFATRFDQVMALVETKRDPPLDMIVVDTAGQIEIFTWSASGNIITELLAGSGPTVVVYIVDTPRCTNPQTFMSNMLQACSILYKTKLPLILAFNKVDVIRHDFALEWMRDFGRFQSALDLEGSYAASLARSLALALDDFYGSLRAVGVSSITGEGMADLCSAISDGAVEYQQFYASDLEARKAESQRRQREQAEADLERLRVDVEAGKRGTREVLSSAQPPSCSQR